MRQPKTTEEFMALPERSSIRHREEVRDGRTIRVPRMTPGVMIPYEGDTVIIAGGYMLAADEDGLYRKHIP